VDRDGAFTSRRGPGEGLLPSPSVVVPGYLMLSPCASHSRAAASCGATKPKLKSGIVFVARSKAGRETWRPCRIESRVVGFYCFEHRRAMEADGGVHSQPSPLRKAAVMMPPRRAIDPSPVPLRLMKAPVAGHPLPRERARPICDAVGF
jgi:hypothetical protein